MTTIIENKEFWQHHVEQLKASGASRKQYCNENNINYDRFGYWLKRLSSVSSSFVPVKLQIPEKIPDTSSAYGALCTLELRGHHLRIHDLSALTFILDRMA